MKITRQAKKRRGRKLCVSNFWVKVKIMKLVNYNYFVDGTWRRKQAQGCLALRHWLLASIHCNNSGLKQRSNKKSKYLEEVLLHYRIFHNGLRWQYKTYIDYMFFRDNTSHKYGAFTPECRYAMYKVPIPLVVGLDKIWCEKEEKFIAVSQPVTGLENRQYPIQETFCPRGLQPKITVIF